MKGIFFQEEKFYNNNSFYFLAKFIKVKFKQLFQKQSKHEMSKKTVDNLNILPHSLSAISNNLDISSASLTGIFQQKKQKDDPAQYKIKIKRPYEFAYKNLNQQTINHQQKENQFRRDNEEFYMSKDEQQRQPKIQAQQIPLKQDITGYEICKHSFSEQQIIQAFKVIDINKDNLITQEDIVFFLQYIKQPFTKQQVRQMIQMVSGDKKKVTFQEFKKIGKGTITPFADIKIPDQNINQKKIIYQNIKNQSSLYNQNPSILVNASKNDIISLKKFQQSKKVSKNSQFQSIKLIDQQEQLNYLIQKIKLLTQEQLQIRKQQFNSIQMVNITQIVRNYHQMFGKYDTKNVHQLIGYRQISKLLQISQKQAKILYGDKNDLLPKKIILEAIVFSPLNRLKKLQLGMMIMLDKRTINFKELYFLMQLLKGKDQSQSLKKKLLTVFKSKNIKQQKDIDKLYALQLIGNYSFNFNF